MQHKLHHFLSLMIAVVWIINGLVCKVMNMVPRHEHIVANILGKDYARLLTVGIGLLEIAMAVWVLSGIWSRFNAIIQIIFIATMNTIEFLVVPGLLLWGKVNAVFAFLFILIIYYNEFHLKKYLSVRSQYVQLFKKSPIRC